MRNKNLRIFLTGGAYAPKANAPVWDYRYATVKST